MRPSNFQLIQKSRQQHLAVHTLTVPGGQIRILERELIQIQRQVRKANEAAHKSARQFSPLVFDPLMETFCLDTDHPCCTDFVYDSYQQWQMLNDWASDTCPN